MTALHETLPHGTTVRIDDGRVVAVVARGGQSVADLTWEGRTMVHAALRLPTGGTISIRRGETVDPVLGPVDELWPDGGDDPVATFGRVDWRRPECVPPLDRPGALPPGAGAAVLNLLAIAARAADLPTVHYRGPYPTGALFDALLSSFWVDGDRQAARGRFVADVASIATAGQPVCPDVAFSPAPFEWAWPDARVCVQHRQGVERIYIDGHAFDAMRAGLRRVLAGADGRVDAVIEIAGQPWARLLTVGGDGTLREGPAPLPAADPDLVGQALPDEVTIALTEIVAERAGGPLAATLRRVGPPRIGWADVGLQLARGTADGVEIHAGLVAGLPTDAGPLLTTLLALVEPLLLRRAQAHLAAAHQAWLDGRDLPSRA